MNTNNIYYQSNKGRLQKQAQNCDHQKSWKEEAKEYYKNNKERLQEQARNKYKELSNKEKDIKREYGKNIEICLKKINKN